MLMGKEMPRNGNHCLYGYDYRIGDPADGYRESNTTTLFSPKLLPIESLPSSPVSSASSSPPPPPFSSASGFIEHRVSKLDTLAGIAIKYGVEVVDIKRANGLTTDLQLFALKSIQIPLPAKHSPSPSLSNGSFGSGRQHSDHMPNFHRPSPYPEKCDLVDSFQSLKLKSSKSKVSPAMTLLQGYYGLKHSRRTVSEGSQIAVCNIMGTDNCPNEIPFLRSYIPSDPLFGSKEAGSSGSSIFDEFEETADNSSVRISGEYKPGKQNEVLLKRRLKSEADLTSPAPEKVLKENGTKNGGGFSAITGKGLALRSKASYPNPTTVNDSVENSGIDSNTVRKSSSTPSFQDQHGTGIASRWRTSGWNLKPDLTTAVIPSSILDGLPKPLSGRKSKAAVD